MNTDLLFTTIRNPLNLMMLVLAAAAGLCASWVLFPLGLLLWAIMIVIQMRDPGVRFSQTLQNRQPLAYRFQQRFNRVERTQVRIFNTIQASKPIYRKDFSEVNEAVDSLVSDTYLLCERMSVLENHRLVTQSRSDLEVSLEDINHRIETADDPLVRREYEESRKSIQAKLEGDRRLNTLLERTEAQLSSVANDLERVLTDVVNSLSLDPEQVAQRVPAILNIIREEQAQIRQFQQNASAL